MNQVKQGEVVTCTLVTGERAVGFYSMTSQNTGSHLIENVSIEGGLKADYVWASKVDKIFDNGLASSL